MRRKYMWILFIILIIIALVWAFKIARHHPEPVNISQANPERFGVTFSTKFAKELDLNWKQAYLDTLEDLEVKYVRIPIYWDEVETKPGEFDYSDYDYILQEGKKRDVKFIFSIGSRLPRWPECHFPEWLNSSNTQERQDRTLNYLRRTTEKYKNEKAIIYWQVENEPFLNSFGECPKTTTEFLQQEIDLVKKIDEKNRPVIVSASGELSSWGREIKLADYFGTTVYRVVWNPIFKYIRYPIPSWFYNKKLKWFGSSPEKALVTELQAEPWAPDGNIKDLSQEEIDKSLSLKQFKANIQYAMNMDFKQTYLWGVEWWYLQKQTGNLEYWNTAKELFN